MRLFYVFGQEYQKSIETDAEYIYQSAQATAKIIL